MIGKRDIRYRAATRRKSDEAEARSLDERACSASLSSCSHFGKKASV